MYYRCLTVLVSMIVLAPVLAKAAEPATACHSTGAQLGPPQAAAKWGFPD